MSSGLDDIVLLIILSASMSTWIQVFIPLLSKLFSVPSRNISSVNDLLKAVWDWEDLRLRGQSQGVKFANLSIRSLVYPVPLEPQNTLRRRVVESARAMGWAGTRDNDEVPSGWRDLEIVHVYLHVNLGRVMQAAETLFVKLWGKDLNVILEEIPHNGTTWKYVPKTYIDSLGMMALGYSEPHGLLVRSEYDVVLSMLNEDHNTAQERNCGGVVITGQPGIGKSCFLYYLLLHRLSEMTPVALQLLSYFVVFRDDGVYRYPLDADPDYLPEGTWALSDSNDVAKQPCTAFLGAAQLQCAWIVQTASPLEERWKNWQKHRNADTFVMNHISIQEITTLGNVLGLNVGNLRRLYKKWGPSARTCVRLSRDGEDLHECRVENAAQDFVKHAATTTKFDEMKVSHL
ncbi:hypothetical protein BJY52DRAFT_1144826, partial [Lactarius psammicola]